MDNIAAHADKQQVNVDLLDFCARLSAFQCREEFLHEVAVLTRKLLAVECALAVLINSQKGRVQIAAVSMANRENEKRLRAKRLEYPISNASDLLKAEYPVLNTDNDEITRYVQQASFLESDKVIERLAIPLNVGRTPVGLLITIGKKGGHFTAKDSRHLAAVAGIASTTLQTFLLKPLPEDCNMSALAFAEAKERILHQLSHTLKTPIAILISSLKLLERHLNQLPDRSWQTIYQRTQRNLTRLLTVAYEVEDIFRQEDLVTNGDETPFVNESTSDSEPT